MFRKKHSSDFWRVASARASRTLATHDVLGEAPKKSNFEAFCLHGAISATACAEIRCVCCESECLPRLWTFLQCFAFINLTALKSGFATRPDRTFEVGFGRTVRIWVSNSANWHQLSKNWAQAHLLTRIRFQKYFCFLNFPLEALHIECSHHNIPFRYVNQAIQLSYSLRQTK